MVEQDQEAIVDLGYTWKMNAGRELIGRAYVDVWSAEVELRQSRDYLYAMVYLLEDEYDIAQLAAMLDVDYTTVCKWRKLGRDLMETDKWVQLTIDSMSKEESDD